MFQTITFVIHLVAILLLTRMLWAAKSVYKIPITFHNLPIIILCGMGMFLGMWLAVTHFFWFIPTGLLFAGIIFTLNSVELPGHPNPSILKKLVIAIVSAFLWPEIIVFCWFYFSHSEMLDAKPEP